MAASEEHQATLPSRARARAWMSRGRAGAVSLAAVAIGLGILASGAAQRAPGGRRAGAPQPPPAPVAVATARKGDVAVYLVGLGTATPLRTVTVKSRVDGQLMSVLFREGQVVKEGDLLAEIDPRPFQVQLEQAEGQQARDQALLENARVDLKRYEVLSGQDSIAQQQVDTQAALVRQYEAALKIDAAQIDSARLQLVYCRITAPIGGRVGLRQVDPGNIVHATDANGLMTLTQLQPIGVVFPIPEDSIPRVLGRLKAGQRLPVEVYDRAQRSKLASGFLLTLDNEIDPSTGTVRCKAEFPNQAGELFPNQFVNARLEIEVKRDATVVPMVAIQRSPQGPFVYVVKSDQTVAVRAVKPGASEGDDVAVDQGLAPGERVVVDGAERLRDGSRVEIPAESSGAPAPPKR